ncbi:16S rRNA (uracil(1498)-N(3))-methyltransferase [Nitrosomonas sp. Nm33]|uniref:16S rRNA (uracil(1498)-N(3))-methyltransferase n=1 Tax=Nitrosomonas sp. Nm33 TaxID=133724 RepID=UPI00089C2FA7|nr:16S rRNA (uracil(1498)-N(3))-methyltransferase [Nitrosomonas sp. Nm33]SDX88482.1 16S rRNA (uracil1498-N3)-methyltransferase [Nitrosomonas sp. Nm33]
MTARFYYPGPMIPGQIITLPINTGHHATRVLRLKQGDKVILFNGEGGEFSGSIHHIDKSGSTVILSQFHAIERESPLSISLVQAVCSNEKMDWIIQKSVELGVNCIQPITATRSVVRLSEERANKRQLHWQQVIIAACEQCGRNRIPKLHPLLTLSDWFSQQFENKRNNIENKSPYKLLLSLTANKRLSEFSLPSIDTPLLLLIGPEGGFTTEEEKAAYATGFVSICLGQRTLRTESAALAAIAAMQALWGDY